MPNKKIYCTLTIKCYTREAAECIINPIVGDVVGGKYHGVRFDMDVMM